MMGWEYIRYLVNHVAQEEMRIPLRWTTTEETAFNEINN